MGYSHYWYRPEEIPEDIFNKIVKDVRLLVSQLNEYGVQLAGGLGSGLPQINPDTISFNGVENCGHDYRDLGITLPAKNGDDHDHKGPMLFEMIKGAGHSDLNIIGQPGVDVETEGYKKWFAGALLDRRECGGDCSHETFEFERISEIPDYQRRENPEGFEKTLNETPLWFNCAKTAFKPYDLAVTAALIICKHHCPDIQVHSDGEDEHWQDAKMVCMEWLGYGEDFKIDE